MAYTTRKSLLDELKTGNEVSWRDFYDTYRPLIVFAGRKYSFQQDEIDDLVQNVMIRIFHSQPTFVYDRKKGKFRTYLGTVINSCACDIIRRRKRLVPLDDQTMHEYEESASCGCTEEWDQEWEKYLFSEALKLLRGRVEEVFYQAFDLYAIQNVPVGKVAKFLHIPVGRVYDAKFRLINMLKSIVKDLQEEKK